MDKWNNFVNTCEMGVIYQTWDWGNIMMRLHKWTPNVLVFEQDNQIVAGAMIAYKKIPFLGKTVVKIPRGFVWKEPRNKELIVSLLEAARHFTQSVSGTYCSFGIYLPYKINGGLCEKSQSIDSLILENKKISRYPREDGGGTYWVDLTQSEDEIFKKYNTHNKRQIKKAVNLGVTIKSSYDTDLVNLFYDYYTKTFTRKGLSPSVRAYFDKGARILIKNQKCRIFYAEYQQQILNLAIISLIGTPRYLWGACSLEEDKPDAPPTGHLLHWEVIKWLKSQQYKRYDFGGSPGYIPQPGHPNYGVWRFKKGFGGDFIEFLETYEYVLDEKLYWVYRKMLPFYKK